MTNLTVQKTQRAIQPQVTETTEAEQLVHLRTSQAKTTLEQFKANNRGLVTRMLRRQEIKVIDEAEIALMKTELEAQKNELEVINASRIMALRKWMECRLMFMNSSLQVELTRSFKQHEVALLQGMNEADGTFNTIIEQFEDQINSYRHPKMREKGMENLISQIERYYDAKERLISGYYDLIDSQKIQP